MDLNDMLVKLDEQLANDEISEETYKEVKLRYYSDAILRGEIRWI
jgi:hypothetical protein